MMLRIFFIGLLIALPCISYSMDYLEEYWPDAPFIECIPSESERVFNTASKAIFSDDGTHVIKQNDSDPDVLFSYPLALLAQGHKQGIRASVIKTPDAFHITSLEFARLSHSRLHFPRDSEEFDTLFSTSHGLKRSMLDDGASILVAPQTAHIIKQNQSSDACDDRAYYVTLDHTESTRRQLSDIPIALVNIGANKPVIIYGDRIAMYEPSLAKQVKIIDPLLGTRTSVSLPESNNFFPAHIRISNHDNKDSITVAAGMVSMNAVHKSERRVYFIDIDRRPEGCVFCTLQPQKLVITNASSATFNWFPNKRLLIIAEHTHTKNFLGMPYTNQKILSYCPEKGVVSVLNETIESDCSESCCLYRSAFEVSPDGKMIIIDKQVRTLPEAFVSAMAAYLHAKENDLPLPSPCIINEYSYIEQARNSMSTLYATASGFAHSIARSNMFQSADIDNSNADDNTQEIVREDTSHQSQASRETTDSWNILVTRPGYNVERNSRTGATRVQPTCSIL